MNAVIRRLAAWFPPAAATEAVEGQAQRLLWRWVAASAVGTTLAYALTDGRVELTGLRPLLMGIGNFLLVAWLCPRHLHGSALLRNFSLAAAHLLAAMVIGGLLQFPCAALGRMFAYRDGLLYRMDLSLGFDWLTYFHFVASRPGLAHLLKVAYNSSAYEILFVLIALPLCQQVRRLFVFCFALWMVTLAVNVVFCAVPARGAYLGLALRPAEYAPLYPTVMEQDCFAVLENVRASRGFIVRADTPRGLIAFPSFHTALSLLLAWALAALPYLRWPAALFNALMVASTPIEGGHYLVDLLAGAATAGLALVLAQRTLPGRDSAGHKTPC